MKIFLDSVGCRLNQSELETFARQFRAAGHTLIPRPDQADMVVINTCTVTASAASDSRQKIRQAARHDPDRVVVTGCWATLHQDEASGLGGVTDVFANRDKDHLVLDVLGSGDVGTLTLPPRQPIPGVRLRTRAFIKVQDGCDNRCTFCVTTLARGAGESLPIDHILADITAATIGGAQEVVLTGVHLGSWGKDLDPGLTLEDLIRTVLSHTEIPRLRLSSLEPWDLSDGFFGLWENNRLCRHIHLPLQSGCAATLRRMARKTTPRSYETLVAAARRAVPNIAITTDIMVGFPGESTQEFQESLHFVQRMGFAGGHVFTYSARPGTASADMPDQVPHPVRKARNAQMRAIVSDSGRNYRKKFIGQQLEVLLERASPLPGGDWAVNGLADNYLRVYATAPRRLWNQLSTVQISAINGDGLIGTLTSPLAGLPTASGV